MTQLTQLSATTGLDLDIMGQLHNRTNTSHPPQELVTPATTATSTLPKIEGYGPHLMLDLNECDPRILDDLDLCFKFLDALPEKLAMNKITSPYVFRYKGRVPEEQGITGVVVIAESHISIHTYPMKHFVFIDMFSCKPFDVEMARQYCIDYFNSKSVKHHLVTRGAEFSTES